MLPQELIPTRLVRTSERPPVVIETPRSFSRLKIVFLLYQLARLAAIALWLRLTLRFTPTRYGRYVHAFLLHLGTVWIKLGQILAMRRDLLPAEFAAELATLRERGTGVPFEMIRRVVEAELGVPLDRYFEEFAPTPFAAATSFQLHRARLRREQVWVAVKVLQPHAEKTFAQDIGLLRRITGWLQRLRVYPKMRWLDLCREVEDASARELDLRFEAASLRQLHTTLPPHGVYVPDVYSRYSTRRVLVMEFIHAALMADYIELKRTDPQGLSDWLRENNIQPRRLAQRLFHSVWRQILEDNFFHADMHPSNVLLLRDNRLAVIDCRGVGQLEAETLSKQRRFIEALADGEYATAAEYSFLLMSRLPLVDMGEVKAHFVRVWRLWETRNYVRELPAAEKSITHMLDGLNRVMYRYHFEAQWAMASLTGTLVNADASILDLASDVNYLQWLRQYFRAAARREKRISLRELNDRAILTLASTLHIPKSVAGASIAQQEILRRQARVYQATTTKSGYVLATLYSFLSLGVMLLAALLSCAFLSQHYGLELEPMLGRQLTALAHAVPALGLWAWGGVLLLLAGLYRRTQSLKRRCLRDDIIRQPEARPAI
ncbi:MAG TPA: AarF/UbiB family protein [Gemmataceae bacterium]|nr:AarF/UbiB family protein [Gemmataceae bacterium]